MGGVKSDELICVFPSHIPNSKYNRPHISLTINKETLIEGINRIICNQDTIHHRGPRVERKEIQQFIEGYVDIRPGEIAEAAHTVLLTFGHLQYFRPFLYLFLRPVRGVTDLLSPS